MTPKFGVLASHLIQYHVPVLYRGDTYLHPENPTLKRLAKRLYLKCAFRSVGHSLATGIWSRRFYQDRGVSRAISSRKSG